MTENDNEDNFLTSKEKYILDEIKFIHEIKADAEVAYSKWESVFMIAEGILIAATSQLLSNSGLYYMVIIMSIIGIGLSIFFFLSQRGNSIYAIARHKRWKKLEKLLSKKTLNGNLKFMAILESQEEERKKHKWYLEKLSTWKIRIYIPILFILIWAAFIIFTYMCMSG